jgi:hypothetical protein
MDSINKASSLLILNEGNPSDSSSSPNKYVMFTDKGGLIYEQQEYNALVTISSSVVCLLILNSNHM